MNGTQYRAVITSTAPGPSLPSCTITSNAAALYVVGTPVITALPSVTAKCAGTSASLSVNYTSGASRGTTLWWKKITDNGANLKDASTVNPDVFTTTTAMKGLQVVFKQC